MVIIAMNVDDTPSPTAADGTAEAARARSEVQLKMARTIVEYLCRRGMNVGNHVTEQELVDEFRISRSPVRAALSYLAEQGVFEQRPNRGYFVKLDGHSLRKLSLETPRTSEENLLGAIARDWFAKKVPESFTEAEFRRRYDLGRSVATRVLFKLWEDGIISRNRGHGWRFESTLHTKATRDESYAFRIVVEPAAIRSPTFELDRGMAELCRRHHELVLDPVPEGTSLGTLSDIDIAFHRMIGVSSRNRFFLCGHRTAEFAATHHCVCQLEQGSDDWFLCGAHGDPVRHRTRRARGGCRAHAAPSRFGSQLQSLAETE